MELTRKRYQCRTAGQASTDARGCQLFHRCMKSIAPASSSWYTFGQPGLVLRETHYPKAEEYFFEPLNERVPVFQRPFRLVQDVMLDASRAGAAALQGKASLTITGTLTYQACDDKICFNPQSLPLTWTIDVKPLDRERAKRE